MRDMMLTIIENGTYPNTTRICMELSVNDKRKKRKQDSGNKAKRCLEQAAESCEVEKRGVWQ